MRIAFVGKGGAGKSVIAGTFARLLAAAGEPVLAVDSDPMPGLALSIGIDDGEAGIADEAVEEDPDSEGRRWRLRAGLSAAEAVGRYAASGPDGLRFLSIGKLRGPVGPHIRSQSAFRQILDQLPADEWSIIGDLPGGTRQPFFGWGRYAEVLVVVAEPTAKSLLSARRLARLATTEDAPRVVAVANKVRGAEDVELVAGRSRLPVVGAVPWDEAVAEAERLGVPPVDHAPESEAIRAVGWLLERLGSEEGPG